MLEPCAVKVASKHDDLGEGMIVKSAFYPTKRCIKKFSKPVINNIEFFWISLFLFYTVSKY